jgi:hypothetical protein
MKPDIYFSITNNCNLECGHCFQSSGPKQPSIALEDFKKVIDNLPKKKIDLTITGGEVFTKKKLLYEGLSYLKKKNKIKERFNVNVQTNGFWATTKKRIREILTDLADFGVTYLDLTSDDKYHFQQGLDPEKLDRIIEEASDLDVPYGLSPRGATYRNILPAGRAKKLPRAHFSTPYGLKDLTCEDCFEDYDLSVNRKGLVSMCSFDLFPLPGNVIEEPLVNIVRRARKNELLSKVNDKGYRGMAYYFGMSSSEISKGVRKYGNCGFCSRLYDKKKDDILEAICEKL